MPLLARSLIILWFVRHVTFVREPAAPGAAALPKIGRHFNFDVERPVERANTPIYIKSFQFAKANDSKTRIYQSRIRRSQESMGSKAKRQPPGKRQWFFVRPKVEVGQGCGRQIGRLDTICEGGMGGCVGVKRYHTAGRLCIGGVSKLDGV